MSNPHYYLRSRQYYVHFTGEEMKLETVTGSRSLNEQVAEVGFEARYDLSLGP